MRRSSKSTAGGCCSASNDSNATCKDLGATRATQRKARRRRDLPTVALVGYTNAGKSTLLNQLTDAGVLVENQLFSTLDPTTRRLRLPGGETVLLSDTVGFVRRLPHQLVDAFRSTLEEVVDADLLLHVVDASAPDVDGRIAAVDTVLREIDAGDVPVLLVWNKADLVDPETVADCSRAHPDSVAISAATGAGIDELLHDDRRPPAGAGRASSSASCPTTAPTCSPRCTARARCWWRCTTRPAPGCGPASPNARRGHFAEFTLRDAGLVSDRHGRRSRSWASSRRRTRTTGCARSSGWPTACPAASSTARSARRAIPCPRSRCAPRPPRSPNSMGYPPSAGSAALREAAAAWIGRRFGVAVDAAHVGACVGTKELVAALPHLLRLRNPQRDTVLYPAIAYPSYEMGAMLAGCRAVPVALDADWHLDLDAVVRCRRRARARCCG